MPTRWVQRRVLRSPQVHARRRDQGPRLARLR
ncbi:MAG: hypothetical protein P8Y00_11430, partial [Deltaproteobacteria bacterium]